MKRLLAIITLLPLGATALAGSADDLKAMQGQWSLTIAERDGKAAGDELKGIKLVILIAHDQYRVLANDKVVSGGTLKVDASKAPHTIDTRITEGPNKGVVEKGIYEIKGDKMIAVFAQPGQERPTQFTTTEGSGHSILRYERIKK
jgi:uncharacterized protein (TIGR03067 family)